MTTKNIERKIIIDTETTGLSPEEGHRIIEIGCIELLHGARTYQDFHCYLNPERDIDKDALKVHGITQAFLHDKPTFRDIVQKLLDYLSNTELIAHNASFDIGFLNHELSLLGQPFSQPITHYCTVFDTLKLARKRHVGQRNSLDALCKRYGIDTSHRKLHGALLDAELLAEVYLFMKRTQVSLFNAILEDERIPESNSQPLKNRQYRLKIIKATSAEEAAHHRFMQKLSTS